MLDVYHGPQIGLVNVLVHFENNEMQSFFLVLHVGAAGNFLWSCNQALL